MAKRLIEISIPQSDEHVIINLLEQKFEIKLWSKIKTAEHIILKIIVSTESSEIILDALENHYRSSDQFKALLIPIEAEIPRVQEIIKSEQTNQRKIFNRISREELYQDILTSTNLNRIFILMVFLSTIVAAVGIVKSNIPALIGAMVIAPFLGPNMALCLGTTLGDIDLIKKSFRTNISGFLTALGLSFLIGAFLKESLLGYEMAFARSVGIEDIALALASGSAGALALTCGVSSALVGVMVAVALLPPTVALGIFLGGSQLQLALPVFLILLTNIICINLSGVLTFHFQGIRPLTWWDENKAKQMRKLAICIWLFLLVLLTCVIQISNWIKS